MIMMCSRDLPSRELSGFLLIAAISAVLVSADIKLTGNVCTFQQLAVPFKRLYLNHKVPQTQTGSFIVLYQHTGFLSSSSCVFHSAQPKTQSLESNLQRGTFIQQVNGNHPFNLYFGIYILLAIILYRVSLTHVFTE